MESNVQLTPIQAELLVAILQETQRVEAIRPGITIHHGTPEWVSGHFAINDLRSGNGVRIGREWLGNGAAARQRRSRGLRSLHVDGLVVLISDRLDGAASHVKLTELGRSVAEELLKSETVQ